MPTERTWGKVDGKAPTAQVVSAPHPLPCLAMGLRDIRCPKALAQGSAEDWADPFPQAVCATRTETGSAVRVILFSAATAMVTSPRCVGRLRARSLGPIRCLHLNMAVSA